MKIKLSFVISCILFLSACNGKSVYGEINPELEIKRFDTKLYTYLTKNQPDDFFDDQKLFLDVFGERVLGIGSVDSTGFYQRLHSYFSEPTLMGMYADEQIRFENIDSINQELSYGMEQLLKEFTTLKQPRIYMHVSGFRQNVIVTDDILSLSADKYLGADYPLYARFFEDYRREWMTPRRIVPDYLLGFMMANFPFEGSHEILLDRIVYEGKLRYILSRIIPERETWEYVTYNEDQYNWCLLNEGEIWKQILKQKHLFTPDILTTDKYIKEAPYTTFLAPESPGRVGVWLGFRIVSSYMENHPDRSLADLMAETNYQQLLKDSKYKPK